MFGFNDLANDLQLTLAISRSIPLIKKQQSPKCLDFFTYSAPGTISLDFQTELIISGATSEVLIILLSFSHLNFILIQFLLSVF